MKVQELAIPYQTSPKTGRALMNWRRNKGLNRAVFAELTNCSERKIATYEKEEQFPEAVERQFKETIRLVDGLLTLMPLGDLAAWLQAPNPGFSQRTPLEVIKAGESDLIWEMIHQAQQLAYS